MIKKESKRGIYILISSICILLLISVASAGVFDWLKQITGRATEAGIQMNITVGVPRITQVYNNSIDITSGPNQYPSDTNISINFTVYSPSGFGNLNFSTARLNVTNPNEDTRSNITCEQIDTFATNYANFSCLIKLFWWDGAVVWNITAYIADNNSNGAQNISTKLTFGSRTGFEMGPGNLTWTAIGAGAVNQTPSNDPMVLNNTGNDVIDAPEIEVNATNLRGETTSTLALWAGNFSIGHVGTLSECDSTLSNVTVASNFKGLSPANLSKGNFTANNYITGQEQLYFCLRYAGSELTTQAYSTANESAWTIRISS
jgi:hypothetical protein